MKAIVLKKFGGIENLHYKEIEKPDIKANEVLVKVKAISINPVDVKVRSRQAPLADALVKYDPLILGWDLSGEITELGKEVTQFSIGNEVFGMINFVGHGSAYAEYVAAPADQLALKPQNISHTEAAASTLAALTAWQAFNSYGKLRPTDRILIHAAAGGVGHFAVQLAKHAGAYVIATGSATNKDFVLGLGADEYIDYKTMDFEEILQPVDFVLDAIGGINFQKSVQVLKSFGTIVALPSGHTKKDELKAQEKKLHACYFMSVYSCGQDMSYIASLLENGILKPHISHMFEFDEIAKAHMQIETGHTVGKIVVKF
ncbi:NADP-dependent oxidoreductase [Sphingobacterium sp. BIGb0165]|uniref:NADP-dependent oxidoreductase n=1 Tax=Sphingobacterium sp. BIGb0165 TaxID=2940615 RepID=UPI002167A36E|nr:NADP-dependent oxidoreductase [Sphingobacterium sp. BIGb0165]MCS4224534.1 NADPH:quinone reductase-like Zn-dependent oxidoreductase [Sphingobacterium sp. BIGb0165]